MAAFTFSEPQAVFETRSDKPSFLRRLFDRLIEARMAEARLHVNAHLMTLDGATLAKYGVDRILIQDAKTRPATF